MFPDFANARLIVERVGDDEIRIRKLKVARRFKLDEMLKGITTANLHGEADAGTSVGNEEL